mgnify:CR=1 FL=1
MISNGCDAITKLRKLEVMGDYTFPKGYKPAVNVIVDPDQKTLKFIDNGIGMTADEVEEYITQIAFPVLQSSLRNIRIKQPMIR